MGMRAVAVGTMSLLTPQITGALIDATGSYNIPFYVSAVLALLGALLLVIAQKLAPPLEKKNVNTEEGKICKEGEWDNNKNT